MSHNNIEVEIKLPLTKIQFDSIKKKIKKICSFVKSSHHIDIYYSPIYRSFLQPKYPYQWLTLRSRDRKYLLNYKHWYPEGVKYTTHCNEYEIEISDLKTAKKMLTALEFKNFITVDKNRQTYKYKQEFEIALDRVKDLGFFIEVEALKDFGGNKKTHGELIKFTKSLGLTRTKTVPGGYAAELMRKKRFHQVQTP